LCRQGRRPNSAANIVSFGIDEAGVEAAAATEITGWSSAMPGAEPTFRMVDQPFYFFITEYSTGACLLSGRIADL
ncbi:MAG: hypothetical protein NC453_13550, partial [Muribaculum sp.]|nr:hypothetical protein [Muribaculum sp.]